MAVMTTVPVLLSDLPEDTGLEREVAEAWGQKNGRWIKAILDKHNNWLKEKNIEEYQNAYDGSIQDIEDREKDRGDGINNKLIANYSQLIIDTVVDYMIAQAPTYKVEDPAQVEDPEADEEEIVKEYRQAITEHLGTKKAHRILKEQLTQGSLASYSCIIHWIEPDGSIDFEEYPVQEVIPVYDTKNRRALVLRSYEIDVPVETDAGVKLEDRTRVEVYDEKYVTWYISDKTGQKFELEEVDEDSKGNPFEHYAGRIPVSIFNNGKPANYKDRLKNVGTSDLSNGAFTLIKDISHKLSDKSNLVEYLMDQYLLLKGVDTDEEEVQKMRKARALALKNPESDAQFISQDQDDTTTKNYMDRLVNMLHDTTFTPNLSELSGKTAYEIKMKYANLDIKAGKKEIYFIEAIMETVAIITDFLNANKLREAGTPEEDIHNILAGKQETEVELYNPDWVDPTLTRNIPQDYQTVATIVATLAGKVPDKYLYELLWFIDDPKKALAEIKEQRKERLEENMGAMGFDQNFRSTESNNDE